MSDLAPTHLVNVYTITNAPPTLHRLILVYGTQADAEQTPLRSSAVYNYLSQDALEVALCALEGIELVSVQSSLSGVITRTYSTPLSRLNAGK